VRITSEAMVLRSVERLQNRLTRYERAQTELSDGRRILRPSDDPAGARRAMSLRSAMQAREQELRNVDDARGWLEAADTNLQTVLSRLARVRELTVQGASPTNPGERNALAMEIEQIAAEIADIANATHLDRPLFGGFGGEGVAVRQVDGAWETYGGSDQVMRRVSDTERVQVNVTAQQWLGFDAPDGRPDLLTFLGQLATDLRNGAPGSQISGHLATLTAASNTVADTLARVGASANRVESAAARATDLSLTLRTELSSVEDLDLAKGITELQVQQVAYEATLAAIGRALPPSLVAFLR
jgi:flagellar hook-associated protein 3 FlgL